jgi:hypothetical protein
MRIVLLQTTLSTNPVQSKYLFQSKRKGEVIWEKQKITELELNDYNEKYEVIYRVNDKSHLNYTQREWK